MADVDPGEWWIKEDIESESEDNNVDNKPTKSKKRKLEEGGINRKLKKKKEERICKDIKKKTNKTNIKQKRKCKEGPLWMEERDNGSFIELYNKLNKYIVSVLSGLEKKKVRDMKELVVRTRVQNKDELEDVMLSLCLCDVIPKSSTTSSSSPYIIIISSSAIRCAHIRRLFTKELSDLGKSNLPVAKLFAKHMKVKDQVNYLEKHKSNLFAAVATPHRLLSLIDEGALSISSTHHFILDWHHRDVKRRRLIDMESLHQPLFTLLYREVLSLVNLNSNSEVQIELL